MKTYPFCILSQHHYVVKKKNLTENEYAIVTEYIHLVIQIKNKIRLVHTKDIHIIQFSDTVKALIQYYLNQMEQMHTSRCRNPPFYPDF